MKQACAFSFGEGSFETMKNMVSALVCDFVEEEHRPDLDGVVSEIEDYMSGLPSIYRTAVEWSLRGLEAAPLLMGYRKQFGSLDLEDRVKVLESFEKSGNYLQRGLIVMLKVLVSVVFFSEPGIERAVGYDHKCLLDREAG